MTVPLRIQALSWFTLYALLALAPLLLRLALQLVFPLVPVLQRGLWSTL